MLRGTGTLAVLTNEELLSINQDVPGARGRRTAVPDGEMWARDLSGERQAVGFFNRTGQDATMSVSFSELGLGQRSGPGLTPSKSHAPTTTRT